MNPPMTLLPILLGLAGLFGGGHFLVAGAAALARRLGVPAFVVGLTVVGFGTSMPELAVSVFAARDGRAGIAIGNVIGSNIANILLILGLAGVLAPLAAPPALRRDLGWMLAAALLCVPVFWNGRVGPLEGAVLLAGLALFLAEALRRPHAAAEAETETAPPPALLPALAAALGGLAAILAGAHFLIGGATALARGYGISEAAIGLTLVAVGTSLPELATSVVAALRGEREIALGNVIGSNVFNVFGILGTTALIAPIPVAPRFLAVDVPVMIGVSLALAGLLLGPGRIGRVAALAGLALYAGYAAAALP